MGELDYIYVLKALDEIPFGVGKKLLMEFLQGKEKNESISHNRLYKLDNFGILSYSDEEINDIIENLLINNLIIANTFNQNKYAKVLELTEKGRAEIESPKLYKKKLCNNYVFNKTEITNEDKERFSALGDFLKRYNDEQKKAIISTENNILCVAGAGSGKTSVLTKRIEFLIRYKSIQPEKILAITFTRKARHEMISRLPDFNEVQIETFNSFCEKILRENSEACYGKEARVIAYKDKILLIRQALLHLKLDMRKAIDIYFTYSQKRGKTDDQLAAIFLNDCFFIRDYFKFKNKKIEESAFENAPERHEKSAEMIFGIVNFMDAYMIKHGLRDFADQLIDTIKLFEEHKEAIPKFTHILIDEYQDVNSTQIKLIDILDPKNLFAVGDPRQSIYGWRGSDINYILNFKEKYPECEFISLTKNYRSNKPIVDLINSSISSMKLPNLESEGSKDKDIKLIRFDSESAEYEFVIQLIMQSDLKRNEIFVLARTNRQLNELSQLMKQRDIDYVIRSEEIKKSAIANEDQVTLATVHAIKGMEAEMVFVIGANAANYPCKGSEHPIIEMVKVDEYDKEEEERRLFYVAMSRAKKHLYISYTGKKPTRFITEDMIQQIDGKKQKSFNIQKSSDIVSRLKDWRSDIAKQLGIPPYVIMHDRTLIDISARMPMTKEDLNDIYGLGPTKIMKYGSEILDIVGGMK